MIQLRDADMVLASTSPRRLQLLSQLGLQPKVIAPDFEEQRQPGEEPSAYVLRNALGKLDSVVCGFGGQSRCLVLAADTVVVHQGRVLEKPSCFEDAVQMLSLLSGSDHVVFSGVALALVGGGEDASQPSMRSGIVTTKVYFKTLGRDEIEAYCAGTEPYDKAGGYAMQGQASYMVEKIEGSFTNVIGLPLTETVDWARDLLRSANQS